MQSRCRVGTRLSTALSAFGFDSEAWRATWVPMSDFFIVSSLLASSPAARRAPVGEFDRFHLNRLAVRDANTPTTMPMTQRRPEIPQVVPRVGRA